MTYQQIYSLIKSTLTGRSSGTKVQVAGHEQVELALLDYIEALRIQSSGVVIRQVTMTTTAGVLCSMNWDFAFPDTNYSFVLNGFDARGNPVEIILSEKSSSGIVVKTLVNATIYAIGKPHVIPQGTVSLVREAHADATAGQNCTLTWNEAFSNTNYSYVITGFDARGNPVEIMLVSKTSGAITVKTLVTCSLMAIANPY